MTNLICLTYFSGRGHTAKLAKAISEGMPHGSARLIDVSAATDADWQAMDDAATIVFGSPTYMGSTAAKFDGFLEEASNRWTNQLWRDKLAAGFTIASHGSGDKLAALQRMAVYAAQMGMIWVGQAETGAPVNPDMAGVNHDGSWMGLMATSSRDKSILVEQRDIDTAYRFGKRIADATERWMTGQRSYSV